MIVHPHLSHDFSVACQTLLVKSIGVSDIKPETVKRVCKKGTVEYKVILKGVKQWQLERTKKTKSK